MLRFRSILNICMYIKNNQFQVSAHIKYRSQSESAHYICTKCIFKVVSLLNYTFASSLNLDKGRTVIITHLHSFVTKYFNICLQIYKWVLICCFFITPLATRVFNGVDPHPRYWMFCCCLADGKFVAILFVLAICASRLRANNALRALMCPWYEVAKVIQAYRCK